MKVILMQDVDKLGTSGEIFNVKPGFARNFLFPKQLATVADEKNVKQLEHNRRAIAYSQAQLLQKAEDIKAKIEELAPKFVRLVGMEGKLFGSVSSKDIQGVILEAGVDKDSFKVELVEPLKEVGEHEVEVRILAGVKATLKVEVQPELQ